MCQFIETIRIELIWASTTTASTGRGEIFSNVIYPSIWLIISNPESILSVPNAV